MITSQQLRELFINFFKERGHTEVASSSLIPSNDPTLLFTNAGMVQFKDVFLGLEKRSYVRATSVQRCVRAGGKHNDLENVGYTARHHTFFEMLGNFSFGDYFKREALLFAWEFLTKVLKIPAEKLWITIYTDDREAEKIWLQEIGIDPSRFSRLGEKSNFWSMGDTGPCGPCSEIFYDHGAGIAGGPPGSPEEDGDRYVEIWNCVFMQYDRDATGKLTPLPKPSVDTGMGLERIAAVMQNVHSNYDIDIFQILIKEAAQLLKVTDQHHHSLKVIADHIRSSAFLIVDGIVPSNEGRGYVLRRIIRRALRHGYQLGQQGVFFHQLVVPLIESMGQAYPELSLKQKHIEKVLLQEEEQFSRTLDLGMKILRQAIDNLTDKIIPGDVLFKLYDTYGFPIDLTADIAREFGVAVDLAGFENEMAKQRQLSKQASQFRFAASATLSIDSVTDFCGYEALSCPATVIALYQQDQAVDCLTTGEQGIIILDKTPFYAEAGGQVGDQGILSFADGQFRVLQTTKNGATYLHHGTVLNGVIKINGNVTANVAVSERRATMRNHSATHLLHAALRNILGEHVTQKGSLVDPERLRFDFAHGQALNALEIAEIESSVNAEIRANHEVVTAVMTPDAAVAAGAMALFGEKYGDSVRVLAMGNFSKELCGGTHVTRTGDIGFFKIIEESAIAAGVRRIIAYTGEVAVNYVQARETLLQQLSAEFNTNAESLLTKTQQVSAKLKQLEKEVDRLNALLASAQSATFLAERVDVKGVNVIATHVPAADNKMLRELLDQLKGKLPQGVIVLASVVDDKVVLVAGVTSNAPSSLHAGKIVARLAEMLGGKGGGRSDMAQGGGTDVQGVASALESVATLVAEMLD